MARLISRTQVEEVRDFIRNTSFAQNVTISGSLLVSESFAMGSDPDVKSQMTGSIEITGSLTVDGPLNVIGDQALNATASFSLESVNTQLFGGIKPEDFGAEEATLFVSSTSGNDTNDGRTPQFALRTVKKAAEIAKAGDDGRFGLPTGSLFSGFRIDISAGTYLEENPIELPKNTTVWGSGLRVTKIVAKNENEDLFWVNSGCYLSEMTFAGLRVFPSVDNSRSGFAIAFAPNSFITTSPYVQNCSMISNQENSFLEKYEKIPAGGGGLNVDGNIIHPDSPLASMVLDAYTQIAPNGVGCQVVGRGFIQLVSFFTNFSAYSVKVLQGGQAVLLNSNTSFGDFGMYASGSRFITGSGGNTQAFTRVRDNYSIIIDTIEDGLTSIPSFIPNTNAGVKVTNELQKFNSQNSSDEVAEQAKSEYRLVSNIVSSGINNIPSLLAKSATRGYATGSVWNISNGLQISGSTSATSTELNIIEDRFDKVKEVLARGTRATASYTLVDNITGLIKANATNPYIGSDATTQSEIDEISKTFNTVLKIVEFGLTDDANPIPALSSSNEANIRVTETPQYNTDISSSAEVANKVSSSFATVFRILELGSDYAPTIVQSSSLENPSIDFQNGYDTLLGNLSFIQNETIAYLSSSWSESDYNEVTCKRDIGYIVSGAAHDLIYGGNEESVLNGNFYYLYPSEATASQKQETLDAIRYAGGLAKNLIGDITYVEPSINVENGYDLLVNNKSFIQNEVISFVSSSWRSFEYDEVKCKRDVGHVINAVATDLRYGGNERSIIAGEFYYKYPSTATTTQLLPTLDGIKWAMDLSKKLVAKQTFTQVSSIIQSTYDLIVENRSLIQQETVNFIDTQFPNLVYSKDKCKRDTGYIIDAVATDLYYGGNQKSIRAGLYYNDVPSKVNGAQLNETIDGISYAKTFIDKVIKNEIVEIPGVVNNTYSRIRAGNVVPFTASSISGSESERVKVSSSFGLVEDIIKNGENSLLSAIAGNTPNFKWSLDEPKLVTNNVLVTSSVDTSNVESIVTNYATITDIITNGIGSIGTPVNNWDGGIKATNITQFTKGSSAATSVQSSLIGDSISIIRSTVEFGTGSTATNATYDPSNGDFVITIPNHNYTTSSSIYLKPESFTFTCDMDNNKTEHSLPSVGQPAYSGKLNINSVTNNTLTVNVGASGPNVEFNPTTASYDPATGDFVMTVESHSLSVGEGIIMDAESFAFTCDMDDNQSTKSYPRLGIDPYAGRSMKITDITDTTLTVNVGISGPNKLFTPSNVNYNALSGDMVVTVGQHGLGVGRSVVLENESIAFTCDMDSDASTHSYPRVGSDPYAGKSIPITSVGTTSHSVTNAPYNPLTGVVTLTIVGHGFTTGDYLKLSDNSLTYTCVLDGSVTEKSYPRAGIDYPSGRWLIISNVTSNTFDINIGASSYVGTHTFVSATSNGVQRQDGTFTINVGNAGSASGSIHTFVSASTNAINHSPQSVHTFVSASNGAVKHLPQSTHTYVRSIADSVSAIPTLVENTANVYLGSSNSITSSISASITEVNKVSSSFGAVLDIVKQGTGSYTPTNATYNPIDGEFVMTVANHGLEKSNGIYLRPESFVFTCDMDGNQTEHKLPATGQSAYAGKLTINSVTNNTISVNVGASGANVQFTPSNTTYNPATGDLVLTIGTHSLSTGEGIVIATGSLAFTCDMDDNQSVKSYPRLGIDPYAGRSMKITNVTSNTITINAGVSGPNKYFTPSNVNYNALTGDMVVTAGQHGLGVNRSVVLENESFAFTCDQDGDATSHSYPRVGSDPYAGKSIPITSVGTTSHSPTNAPYNSTTGVVTLTITNHNFSNGDYIKVDDSGLTYTCVLDGNTVTKSYPRAGYDYPSGRWLPIANVTTNTFDINIGASSYVGAHTFVSATTNGIKRQTGTFTINVGDGGSASGSVHTFVSASTNAVKHEPQSVHTFVSASVDAVKHLPQSAHTFVRTDSNSVSTLPTLVGNISDNIRFTNEIVQITSSVSATAVDVSFISSSIAIVTDIITNGTGSLPTTQNYVTAITSSNVVAAYNLIKNNIPFIQAETIAYLSSSWSQSDYNEDSCSRDVGAIVSGAAEDLLYGVVSSSVFNGKYYYDFPSQAQGSQLNQTLDGINYASKLTQKLIQNIEFTTASSERRAAWDLIDSNIDFIKDETILYLSSSWSQYNYNEVTCKRDVNHILDAVRTDIYYGGNERTINAGVFYWEYPSQAIVANDGDTPIGGQLNQTLDGINHSRILAEKVIVSTPFSQPTQAVLDAKELLDGNKTFIKNEVVAFVSSSWSEAGYNEVTCKRDVVHLLDASITDMVYGGNERTIIASEYYYRYPSAAIVGGVPSPTQQKDSTVDAIKYLGGISEEIVLGTTFALADSTKISIVNSIRENRNYIQQNVLDYIRYRFPKLNYSQAKCYRDIGFITDAIVTDLLYGGNARSINAGVFYYKFPSQATGYQIEETIIGINYGRDLTEIIIRDGKQIEDSFDTVVKIIESGSSISTDKTIGFASNGLPISQIGIPKNSYGDNLITTTTGTNLPSDIVEISNVNSNIKFNNTTQITSSISASVSSTTSISESFRTVIDIIEYGISGSKEISGSADSSSYFEVISLPNDSTAFYINDDQLRYFDGREGYALGGEDTGSFKGSKKDPTLTLVRNEMYNFSINDLGFEDTTINSPFLIKTKRTAGTTFDVYESIGLINNGITFGTLTFTPLANTPDTLYYVNPTNISASGVINIVDSLPLSAEQSYVYVPTKGEFEKVLTTANNIKITSGIQYSSSLDASISDRNIVSGGFSTVTDIIQSGVGAYTPTTATYNPANGDFVISISQHGLEVGETIYLKPESFVFTCGMDGNRTEHKLPSVGQSAYNNGLPIKSKTNNTITLNVGLSGPNVEFNPTNATYDPSNGNFVVTVGTHSLSVGEGVVLSNNSFAFTCDMDNNQSTKSYPRVGIDPFAVRSLPITSVTDTTMTFNVGASGPNKLFTPSNANYNALTGDMTVTVGQHGLGIGRSVVLENESIAFTCDMDGGATTHSYPRLGSDPYAGKSIPITSVGNSSHTPTNAPYNASTGLVTLTIAGHTFSNGDYIKVEDGGLTYSCVLDGNTISKSYPRAGYDYPSGRWIQISNVTTDTFDINIGSSSYTGAHTFVSATTGGIKRQTGTFTINVGNAGSASGSIHTFVSSSANAVKHEPQSPHTFVSASNGSVKHLPQSTHTFVRSDYNSVKTIPSVIKNVDGLVKRGSGTQYTSSLVVSNTLISKISSSFETVLNIIEHGTGSTPTNATYDPANGDFVMTIPNHTYKATDSLYLQPNSFTFTCDMDGNKTEHILPSVGQPAYNSKLRIKSITDSTIKVNVGASGPNVQFTPSGVTYDPANGNLVMTVGTHSLSVGEGIIITTGSLAFSCTMDNNQSVKSYPRLGIDPYAGRSMKITNITDTTITINAGVSGPNKYFTPTNVDYNALSGDMILTVSESFGLGVGRSIVLEDNSFAFTCDQDGDTTTHSYPRFGSDPYARKSIAITSVGTTQHTPTNAPYIPSTGIVTLTIVEHGFVSGDYIKVDDSGLTYTCILDGNVVEKAYPRPSFDYPSGRWLAISNVTTNTFDINIGASSYTGAHTFVSATTNGIKKQDGTFTINVGDAGSASGSVHTFVSASNRAVKHEPQSVHTFVSASNGAVKHLPQSTHTFVRSIDGSVSPIPNKIDNTFEAIAVGDVSQYVTASVSASIDDIAFISESFEIVTRIIEFGSGSYESSSLYGSEVSTTTTVAAYNLLKQNINFIKEETIAYLSSSWSAADYNELSCSRDIAGIVSGAAEDLIHNVYSASVFNGKFYLEYPSQAQGSQLNQTLDGIRYASKVAQKVASNVTFDSPTSDRLNTQTILNNNKEFIKEEAISFLSSSWSSFDYPELTCKRDIVHILDASITDIVYGGNERTINAGVFYWKYPSEATGSQLFPTLDGIQYAGEVAQKVVSGEVFIPPTSVKLNAYNLVSENRGLIQDEVIQYVSSSWNAADYDDVKCRRDTGYIIDATITDLLYGGNERSVVAGDFYYKYPSQAQGSQLNQTIDGIVHAQRLSDKVMTNTILVNPSIEKEGLYQTIEQNRELVQAEVIAYISSSWVGFDYDEVKCNRDVGHILDAVSTDLRYGGNERSVVAGEFYWRYPSEATNVQKTQTIDGIVHAANLVQKLIQNVVLTQPSSDKLEIWNTIRNNRTLIQSEVTAYIDYAYPFFTYNRVKCRRDVGHILDGVATDVLWGGNQRSVKSGEFYYLFPSEATTVQKDETIDGIRYAESLVKNIIANKTLLIPSKVSNTDGNVKVTEFSSVTSSIALSGSYQTEVSKSYGIVTGIINDGIKSFTPTTATYNPANGDFVMTIGNHSLTTNNGIYLKPDSFTFTCDMDGNKTEHNLPSVGQPAYNNRIKIKSVTEDTITLNVGKSGPNVEFTPTTASYDPATGDFVMTVGTHSLSVGEGIIMDTGSFAFTCDMDNDQSVKSYPRLGIDPYAGRSMKITDISDTTLTVNVGVSGPNKYFTPTNVNYNALSGDMILTVSESFGLGVGRSVVLENESFAFTCDQDGNATTHSYPRSGSDPYAEKSIVITSVGTTSHSVTNAPYTPSTGLVTLTITDHGFTNGDYIKLSDNSLTYTCVLDGSIIQKSYPRAGYDYPSGRWLVISNVTTNTFDINIGSSSYTGTHTFVSATSNGVQRQTGTFTINVGDGGSASGSIHTFVSSSDRAVKHLPQSLHTFISSSNGAVKHLPQSNHTFVRTQQSSVSTVPVLSESIEGLIKITDTPQFTSVLSGSEVESAFITRSVGFINDIIKLGTDKTSFALAKWYDDTLDTPQNLTTGSYVTASGTYTTDTEFSIVSSSFGQIINIIENGTGSLPTTLNNTSNHIKVTDTTQFISSISGSLTEITKVSSSIGIIENILQNGVSVKPTISKNNSDKDNLIKVTDVAQITSASFGGRLQQRMISSSISIVTNIVTNGTGSLPTVVEYGTQSDSVKTLAAYNLLKSNIGFIQSETIAYLSSSWSTASYDESKCSRDIGGIISGAAEDMLYNANSSSIFNGKFYYDFPSKAQGAQLQQTLDGINYAGRLAESIVRGYEFQTASAVLSGSVELIRNNREFIENETIAFLSSSWDGFTYNEITCKRDVTHIIDAVSTDLLYGGNERSVNAGDYYYRYPSAAIIGGVPNENKQKDPTVTAVDFVQGFVSEIVSGAIFQTASNEVEYVYNAIRNNREFIQSETVEFVNAKYPNLDYKEASCKRDTGFIIDAVATDLRYGGNQRALTAGEFYYRFPSKATGVQIQETTDALIYAKDLIEKIVDKETLFVPTGSLNTDNGIKVTSFSPLAGGDITDITILNTISSSFSIVSDAIANGKADVTPTNATYDPSNGNFVMTVESHSFDVGDGIYLSPESFTFTCDMDNNKTEHSLPSVGQPAYNKELKIVSKTDNTITLNVGVSGPNVEFNPTTASYDPSTGDFVMTVESHSLSVGEGIVLDPQSFAFTCDMDNNQSTKSYPRVGIDPFAGRSMKITSITGTTMTVNVGVSGPNKYFTPSNVNYNALSGDMVITANQHGLGIGRSVVLENESFAFTCDMDSNATTHSYPRSGSDPYAEKSIIITSVGTTSHNVTNAPYDASTGDITITISNHTFSNGDYIKLSDNSLTYTCVLDGNTVEKSYPRTGIDTPSGRWLVISNVTTNTFDINIGSSSYTSAHTFVSATTDGLERQTGTFTINVGDGGSASGSIHTFVSASTNAVKHEPQSPHTFVSASNGAIKHLPQSVHTFVRTQNESVSVVQPALEYGSVSSDSDILSAYGLITESVPFIQNEVVEYISSSWFGFDYDSAKCRRDVGFIVNGVAEDLRYGIVSASSVNAKYYYQFPSEANGTGSQSQQTIDGINYASQLADQIVKGVSFSSPSTQISASVELLRNNREFIQSESISYLSSSWDGFEYSESTCRRDVGHIIDAVSTDLLYGGTQRSKIAGEYYYKYPSSATTTQLEPTTTGIKYAGDLGSKIVEGSVFITASAERLAGNKVLLDNKEFIQNEVISYISSSWSTFNYNEDKCKRDTGYILNGVATDFLYGGNERTKVNGEYYFEKPSDATLNYQVTADATKTIYVTPTNATYDPATGDFVMTVESHGLNVGEGIYLSSESFTFTCDMDGNKTEHSLPSVGQPAYNNKLLITSKTTNTITVNVGISGPNVEFNPTNATYNPATGDFVITTGTHSLSVGEGIILDPQSFAFTCDMDNNQSVKSYPRVGIDPYAGRSIKITSITGTTMTVNVGVSAPNKYFTPSNVNYNALSGDMVVTANQHGLGIGRSVVLENESFAFTCDQDGNATTHSYPRSGSDPYAEKSIIITSVGTTSHTVTNAPYDASNGDITLTIFNHNFSNGDYIKLSDNSLTYTCVLDGNSVRKSYPRTGIDNPSGRWLPISNVTTNTFDINIGSSSYTNTHTFVSATTNGLERQTGTFTINVGDGGSASGSVHTFVSASTNAVKHLPQSPHTFVSASNGAVKHLPQSNHTFIRTKQNSVSVIIPAFGQLNQTIDGINYSARLAGKVMENATFVSPTAEVSASAELLRNNRSFVQNETIEFISSSWSNVKYSEDKCRRDTGYIIDAAVTDLVYGGNERSTTAGLFYWRYPSRATVAGVPSEANQLDPTVDGIRFANGTSQNVVQNLPYTTPSAEITNGVQLLRDNTTFIQKETIAYLSSSWSEFEYNEASCSRDLGYIIDAVATDLTYGGNERAVQAGTFYYYIPSIATTEQKPQTTDGIDFSKGLAEKIIKQKQLVFPFLLNKNGANALRNAKKVLQGKAISYTNAAFPNFVYNEEKCYRDTGFILDAIVTDITYGGNERSIRAAESYYNGVYGSAAVVVNEQKLETAETNRYLRTQFQFVARQAPVEQFGSLIITTGHDFSYSGAGVTYKALPPNQGGDGIPDPDKEITEIGGGRVFFTSGNELGDFRIGGGLVIKQASGTLEGRTFSRSLFSLVTPFSLALQD